MACKPLEGFVCLLCTCLDQPLCRLSDLPGAMTRVPDLALAGGGDMRGRSHVAGMFLLGSKTHRRSCSEVKPARALMHRKTYRTLQ